MKKSLFLAAALCALAACASSPEQEAAKAAAAAPAISTVPAEGLPPQRLAPGECGLFLWSMSAPRRFVFFTKGSSGDALVLIGDKTTTIPMTSAGGDVFGQFLTKMTFEDLASKAKVSVSIDPGKPLEGGQRVESGNIQFRDADGWETVLPVTGVRACMPG
jgi:hypothetical protein